MKTNQSLQSEPKRSYRQGARAEAAARTADAIVTAFAQFLETQWYDDVSLERVAQQAGTTVQTLLRHFGSKEGLLTAFFHWMDRHVHQRRGEAPGNIDATIAGVLEDYEQAGDMVVRFLAQEERIPALRSFTDHGKASHRRWVQASFAPWLDGLDERERGWRTDGLVVALDIYVWKLLRRDRGRSPEEVGAFMKSLVHGILGPDIRPAA
jgi:AcrR family transcriptional regulator